MLTYKPLVSVLMNCHNGDRFLNQSICSILTQDYHNIELIFFDNCSSDRSAEIVKSYKDARIKYFRSQKKLSLSEARIEAWKYISGEYVAILDTDDLSLPGRISKQVNFFLENKNISVLGGNSYFIDNNSNIIGNTDCNDSIKELSKKIFYSFPLINSTLMFKKKCVDSVGGYPKEYTMINDYVLVYNLSKKFTIANTLDFLSKTRYHQDSLTNKKHLTNLIEQYNFLTEISLKIKNKEVWKKNQIYISRYYIKILYNTVLKLNFSLFISYLLKINIYKVFLIFINPK